MRNENQELVIILPDYMKNSPVRIIRGEGVEELNVRIFKQTYEHNNEQSLITEDLYSFVWHNNTYECIPLNEIMWIEADGSYCSVHTSKNRTFTLSYPLIQIQERLPQNQFIRIQRSCVVNKKHVKRLIGCSLVVGEKLFKIGNSYKKKVFNEFIFLGIHGRSPSIL